MALRLWLDCHDQFDSMKCAQGNDEYHLGSIITYQEPISKRDSPHVPRYVVDGQQRLVTLWIFFRAMYFWCSHHVDDFDIKGRDDNFVWIAANEKTFGHNMTVAMVEERLKFPPESSVEGFFHEFFAKKIFDMNDWKELKELLCHERPDDQEQKMVNVFRAALFFMCNHFGNEHDRDFVHSLSLDSADHHPMILNYYRDKYLNKDKKFDVKREVEDFAEFMLEKLEVAHIDTASWSKAVQMYRSINNQRDHAEAATQMEILKAMLQVETTEHQDKYDAQWENCASEFLATTKDEFDLFVYYMHVIVELTARPPGRLDKDSMKDFLKSEKYEHFEHQEPYQCTLIEHIQRRFILEDQVLVDSATKKRRFKLFDVENPTKVDENALDLFFSKWMNTDSVVCFLGFLRVDDHRWAQGRYLGQTSSKRIQNTVTLLKHVAHTGLDMDWVAPAFFFVVKFRCMQSSDHLNAAAEFF